MKRPIDATTLRAEFTGNFNGGYYTVAEIKAIIDTAPTLDKDINVPGKWISVEEGMPEDGTLCVVRSDKTVLPAISLYTSQKWLRGQYYPEPTHWMPLPPEPEVSE